MLEKLYNWWVVFVDNKIIPFLRSKKGMYIIFIIIIWIILY